ncbi:MAG: TfoX/Sxy family protein [Saprospiraceae bacterium]
MINEKLNQRIREALSNTPAVQEKKMFRGMVFMVNGKMCITASDTHIMCRIDPALHDEAVKKKGCHSVFMGGREYRGYVQIDENAIKTKKDLTWWIKLALEFNPKAKASKKNK